MGLFIGPIGVRKGGREPITCCRLNLTSKIFRREMFDFENPGQACAVSTAAAAAAAIPATPQHCLLLAALPVTVVVMVRVS